MTRKEGIDYIDKKTAFCFIDYRFNKKERAKSLRLIADDIENYNPFDVNLWSLGAYLVYKRLATKEEIQKELDQKQLDKDQELNILKCRAERIGYKLVKE